MAKYELKTKVNDASVKDFINSVANADRRAFCHTVIDMMYRATSEQPRMWGKAIVGFGTYTYTYASGQSGDWMRIGFSPRKSNVSLYLMSGFDALEQKLEQLGKYKTGKSCLYVTKQSDVDMAVLQELIDDAVSIMADRYGAPGKAKASGVKAKRTKKKGTRKKAAVRSAAKKRAAKKRAAKKKAVKRKPPTKKAAKKKAARKKTTRKR